MYIRDKNFPVSFYDVSACIREWPKCAPALPEFSSEKKKYKFMDKMSFIEVYKEVATQNENHNPGAESGMYTKRQ